MKRLVAVTAALFFCGATTSEAQLLPPNDAGVSMGQWHLHVRDMEANKKFWTALGGVPVAKLGPSEVFKFPGVFVILTQAIPTGPAAGSIVNHAGFQVPNVQQAGENWKAAGLVVEAGANPNVRQIFLPSPDGIRVEILEDQTMTVPIKHHHVHWNVPPEVVPEIQRWYVQTFGAKAGMRGNFQAADLPGANLTFSPTKDANVPTKGRALDHIGFEIANLEAFCNKLQTAGVKFDQPYAKNSDVANALITDPWGTSIELTEGLATR